MSVLLSRTHVFESVDVGWMGWGLLRMSVYYKTPFRKFRVLVGRKRLSSIEGRATQAWRITVLVFELTRLKDLWAAGLPCLKATARMYMLPSGIVLGISVELSLDTTTVFAAYSPSLMSSKDQPHACSSSRPVARITS